VTGIYFLNYNIFDEDEFLYSYVTDRSCSQVTELANGPSSSKDNDEGGKSARFVGSNKYPVK